MPLFDVIVAVDLNNGIGVDNTIPWKLPSDMKRFKDITTCTDSTRMNAVIMGRKTWASIPHEFRPLKRRVNVVLSRDPRFTINDPSVIVASSLDQAIDYLSNREIVHDIFVAGGTELYTEAIEHPCCRNVHITRLCREYECDAFFPSIDNTVFSLIDSSPEMMENDVGFHFETWRRSCPYPL